MNIDEALQLTDETETLLAIREIVWNKADYGDDLQNITDAEKTFIYVDILEGEVNNGGFDQFFFNSSGEYAHEALEAYERIGAYKTADLIYRAIRLFPVLPIPKDTETRREIMRELDDSISRKWNKLDDEFYEYEDNVAVLMIEFIKKNRIEFEWNQRTTFRKR